MDIGKGSKDIIYVEGGQVSCAESEEMVVKFIETTKKICCPDVVGSAGIWKEVDLPKSAN